MNRRSFLKGVSVAAFAGAAMRVDGEGVAPRALDAKTLVDTLKSQGVFLG